MPTRTTGRPVDPDQNEVGSTPRAEPSEETRNEVLLVGRLSAPASDRELPSGDVLTTWRLVVDRPAPPPSRAASVAGRAPTVDALECATWARAVRRSAMSWQVGDLVEVHGALRRRFWRAGNGPNSRYEVEVTSARRVRRG